jgi:hypothetical protein
MSEPKIKNSGEIPLHNTSAIGLQPETGGIGLYKPGDDGWIVGIRLNVDLRHFRKQGSTTGFMTLNKLELVIPGENGMYTGRIEGWDHYKTYGYTELYKPVVCQLLPDHPEWTTFAWLDAPGVDDPYFYFGWGLRNDLMPPLGYRRRAVVAYMGVNYPIRDGIRPSFTEIPPEDWLKEHMIDSAPAGTWELKADVSGFTVDEGVMKETHAVFRIVEGRSRFIIGELDFVKHGDIWVGESDQDLSGVFWGSGQDPGLLKILSGPAKNREFRIVGSFYSGENPPPGFPPNTWCLKIHFDDGYPSSFGVTAGTEYRLTSPFIKQVLKLVEYYEKFGPGVYPPQNLYWEFIPIL